jgi:hypothetical protein
VINDHTLAPEEIAEMTGKVQAAAQIRHLRRMGIKAERSDNPDRPVVVCRAWLGVKSKAEAESRPPMLKSDRRGQASQTR